MCLFKILIDCKRKNTHSNAFFYKGGRRLLANGRLRPCKIYNKHTIGSLLLSLDIVGEMNGGVAQR